MRQDVPAKLERELGGAEGLGVMQQAVQTASPYVRTSLVEEGEERRHRLDAPILWAIGTTRRLEQACHQGNGLFSRLRPCSDEDGRVAGRHLPTPIMATFFFFIKV